MATVVAAAVQPLIVPDRRGQRAAWVQPETLGCVRDRAATTNLDVGDGYAFALDAFATSQHGAVSASVSSGQKPMPVVKNSGSAITVAPAAAACSTRRTVAARLASHVGGHGFELDRGTAHNGHAATRV